MTGCLELEHDVVQLGNPMEPGLLDRYVLECFTEVRSSLMELNQELLSCMETSGLGDCGGGRVWIVYCQCVRIVVKLTEFRGGCRKVHVA